MWVFPAVVAAQLFPPTIRVYTLAGYFQKASPNSGLKDRTAEPGAWKVCANLVFNNRFLFRHRHALHGMLPVNGMMFLKPSRIIHGTEDNSDFTRLG